MPFMEQILSFGTAILGAMKVHLLFLLAALALPLTGCKTTGAAQSSRLASVVIKGRSKAEITQAAQHMFEDNGYLAAPLKSADLVFEKQGSGMKNLLYGDWSGKPVWVRVKLYFRDLGSEGILLEGDAFLVLERGDPHFEEERKVRRASTYQELLNKVKQRLQ